MSMSRDTKNVKICCIYVDVKGHADMYVCMYSSVSSGTSVFCLEITSTNIYAVQVFDEMHHHFIADILDHFIINIFHHLIFNRFHHFIVCMYHRYIPTMLFSFHRIIIYSSYVTSFHRKPYSS